MAYSVLYAVLQGVSESLQIARDNVDGSVVGGLAHGMPELVLMDTVPGGAGYANLIAENTWFLGATLSGVIGEGLRAPAASFSTATIESAVLNGADLRGADFRGAHLVSCLFGEADVSDARFDDARFEGCWFGGARIAGASFEGADGVDLDGAL